MSKEKIIQKIASDADEKVKAITDEADQSCKELKKQAKQEIQQDVNQIIAQGEIQAENAKKILITQALQDGKRKLMNEKEKIIQQCFSAAVEELSSLSEKKHKQIVSDFIVKGIEKLGKNCHVFISKSYLKDVAQDHGVNVSDSIKASGGVLIQSQDNTVILDYTFEGILHRKQAGIRVEVGKILFTT